MDHTVESQDEVFAFLGDARTHGVQDVRRIDTHAASVFLMGERALKVKRAVKFPFLDYSTLDRRRQACAAELEVNRPYAPDIYLGVVAITRAVNGQLELGGQGAVVEWAVEMRRFDETRTLDRLAETEGIDPELADALGRVVAKAHAAAPAGNATAWIAEFASYLAQNTAELNENPDLFPPAEIEKLDRRSRTALAQLRPLLEKRAGAGLIRRIHGDLHLGNIALIGGGPVPFDAIEFDPIIGTGDVLYDLAFLLMDLVERGLTAAANIVLNRYLWQTRRSGDLDALAALPLFMSVRAAIRAKVTAARREAVAADAAAEFGRSARDYFRLAGAFLSPPAPRLVAIGGLSGTGKSALARMLAPGLAPAPGAVVLRSDIERKALFGIAETDRLGGEAYTPDVTAKVYSTLADKAARVLAAGYSVVVDAVFAQAGERGAIAAMAARERMPFSGCFLVADLATRIARVGARVKDASDADAAVARAQERYDLGALDWRVIDADGTPTETLERTRAALGLGAP